MHFPGELDHTTAIFFHEEYFSDCLIYRNLFHYLRMKNNMKYVYSHSIVI